MLSERLKDLVKSIPFSRTSLGEDRPSVFMIAENEDDVSSCFSLATIFRRSHIKTHTPLVYVKVKKQFVQASRANPHWIVIVDKDTGSIRCPNSPVRLDGDISDIALVIIDLETNDYDSPNLKISSMVDQILSDCYFHTMGIRPSWDKQTYP